MIQYEYVNFLDIFPKKVEGGGEMADPHGPKFDTFIQWMVGRQIGGVTARVCVVVLDYCEECTECLHFK